MIDGLHNFLNLILFPDFSDLAWSGVRAVTAIASGITAYSMRRHRHFVFWAALLLSGWIGLKIFDDINHAGQGPKLTVYFLVSNLLWATILLGIARWGLRKEKT